MRAKLPIDAEAVVGKARKVAARVRPGATEGRRSLPIRRPVGEVQRLWTDERSRATVLEGIPAAETSLELAADMREGDGGTRATVTLRLEAAVPGMATHALAGKAVRRLKALAETGEAPTTDRNPSARADAGEEASS